MKFPYGISNFKTIITEGYYYRDRTGMISKVENAGKFLLLIRPRRFGKSLWLSTLRYYYDISYKNQFFSLFGNLKISADQSTTLHSRYFVLQWDFSCVDPTGSVADIKRSLHNHINGCVQSFAVHYRGYLGESEITVTEDEAVRSFRSLLDAVANEGHLLYLLIDEYDNFANEVMASVHTDQDAYKALVHEKGPLKTLFKAVKSAAGEGTLDRIFITGVSPVVMSDITSGFNIAENIYLKPAFNDLCGFTEAEIEETLREVTTECDRPDLADEALEMMRTYYNGYRFSPDASREVYNPTLALYFMKAFQEDCRYPREMLDANLSTDEAKLAFVAGLPRGHQLLLQITRNTDPVSITGISNRFGVSEMLNDVGKTQDFLLSFLYYFGVLSISGLTPAGKLSLKVPNLVTRGLYVERIARFLLPDPGDRDDGRAAAEFLRTEGKIEPLCDFVEKRYFRVFHNPDYKWANELTVKTAFLTLLYDDIRFIMDSEMEAGRGFADLTMIIRPDMRRFALLDLLLEFKYVKLSEAGLTGEAARKLTPAQLHALPVLSKRMAEAEEQGRRYGADLRKKYGNLRLHTFAVVSLGFERLWAKEIA